MQSEVLTLKGSHFPYALREERPRFMLILLIYSKCEGVQGGGEAGLQYGRDIFFPRLNFPK